MVKISCCDRCHTKEGKLVETVRIVSLRLGVERIRGELCGVHAKEVMKSKFSIQGYRDYLGGN